MLRFLGQQHNYETMPRLFTEGRSAGSLNFSSTTISVVSVSDTANLRPETTSLFTWVVWMMFFNTNNNVLPRIMEKTPHFACIMGDQNNGRRNQVALEVANVDASTTEYWGSTRLTPNRWYHIAIVFDNVTGQHYVNGVAETMTTLLGPYVALQSTSGNPLLIGNRATNSRNPYGLISDVRYYNRALSATEISQLFCGSSITSGLVGYWKLNDGGSSSADSSGNSNTGTSTNTLPEAQ